MREIKLIFVVLSAMALISCGSKEESEQSSMPETTNNMNEQLGGVYDLVYECNAEYVKGLSIEYNPIVVLETELEKSAFVDEIKQGLISLTEDANSLLYEKAGCYLSSKTVCLYDIQVNTLANAVRCYFFTEDKQMAGEIMFFMSEGELMNNISWYTANSSSDILNIMSDVPEKQYVILTNGLSHTLIDDKNISSNPDYKISGDVYSALDNDCLSVSYNDIVENLVWVELD